MDVVHPQYEVNMMSHRALRKDSSRGDGSANPAVFFWGGEGGFVCPTPNLPK